jgi:hypothetical protein
VSDDERRQEDETPTEDDAPGRPEGEDHREGAPGYDLDEQRAIHELMDEREREGED